jgi:dihydroorotate dehydrogenase (fumarate)
MIYSDDFHPEAYGYAIADASVMYGTSNYLKLIEQAKTAVDIPVIASVNCLGGKWWTDFATEVEQAGADALELNIAYLPFEKSEKSPEIERKYTKIVSEVKKEIKIPVAAKISQYFTNIPGIVAAIEKAGADAVVMFNRYYRLGIDINKHEFKTVDFFSTESETYNVLRWVGITSSQVSLDISATTGIHSAEVAIQHFLSGAKTIQVASAMYTKGEKVLKEINRGIEQYLDKHKYNSLDDIRSLMVKDIENRKKFERIQYMRVAGGYGVNI